MMLEECLLICRHYESLQWHINTVRPTDEFKAMDGLARQHPRSRSKSNTRRPPSTVCPDRPKNDCTACGTLHQVRECPASSIVCFKCNKQGHYAKLCHSKVQSTTSTPSSNRNTRGSWHSRGRGGRGSGSKHAVYEAETTDTSKPIVDATNSEVDVVQLLQAYGMVPTEGSELKHRRKKVATDEISTIQTLGDDFTFEPKPLILPGSLVECNISVQWKSSNEDIVPINLYIAIHTVSMEVANPLDWSFGVHLMELDDVHTDLVYSNMELNGTVLKAKQDTGAQINV